MTTTSERRAPRARLERILRSGAGWSTALWLGQHVVLLALGATVVALWGGPDYAPEGLFGVFYRWDSGFFACIAQYGYLGQPCDGGSGSERIAFFPLYPLLAQGVAWVASLGAMGKASIAFGLWLVAAVASLAATIGVHRVAEHGFGSDTARRATALFVLCPYAVFLVASYSEALYLAGAVWAWHCCQRGRYWLAGALGIVATATRASGMFLVLALLVLYLVERRMRGERIRVVDVIAIGTSGLGILAYWVWLWASTGDLLAWFRAQGEGWGRRTSWPWETLVNQGIHVLREPRWDWQLQAVLETAAAVLIVVCVVLMLRRREWASATLTGTTALSLMTSTSYLSLARNTLTLFPIFILLADVLRGRLERWYRVVLWGGAALLLFNTVQLALGNWAD